MAKSQNSQLNPLQVTVAHWKRPDGVSMWNLQSNYIGYMLGGKDLFLQQCSSSRKKENWNKIIL